MGELLQRHRSLAIGLTTRRFGRDDELDDFLQDLAVAAITQLPQLRNGQAFARWYGCLTVGYYAKRRRRRTLEERHRAPLEHEPPARAQPSPEVTLDLTRALARIEPQLREAVMKRCLEQRPLPEVAELLGVSLSTIKRQLTRAHRAQLPSSHASSLPESR